jgi:general secretion pathway protein D
MRWPLNFAAGLLVGALAALPAHAGDNPAAAPIFCSSGIPGGVNCVVTKRERKEAHEAYVRGTKLLDRKQLEAALAQFELASQLVPQSVQFLSAREMVKAQLVFNHVQKGNLLLSEELRARAGDEFRAALDLDPDNPFARERLGEASLEPVPDAPTVGSTQLADTGEIHLEPKNERATFHFEGDARGLFMQLASAYGVRAQFDDSMPNRQVQFYVGDVDFFTAIKLACQVDKAMWSALDAHSLLLAADNPENHKQFDRMSLRTFVLPSHATPQEVTEMTTTLRTMFDLRFLSPGQASGTLEVRASQPILEACTKLLDQLSNQRPQVMLDVRIFQIDHQLTRNLGVNVPTAFNLYNIPTAALAGLAGQNIQSLINQLISSGGINQAGGTSLSALLAQLGGGQTSSIFSQPLTTFGGGLTFMGLSLGQLVTSLSTNESWSRSLSHLTMRAGQGSDATFHLGERYPIMNASYAPIYNSPQISQVLGNNSYVAPFPSVSYEDLGLTVKAKPTIHADGDVSLQLELQVRSLTGQSDNGVPLISNREYKGSINLKDGEPAVVAGEVSQTDTLSMTGLPGFGFVPLLNQAMINNTKQSDSDELMIIITPHVLANINVSTPEIWISEK